MLAKPEVCQPGTDRAVKGILRAVMPVTYKIAVIGILTIKIAPDLCQPAIKHDL